MIDADVLPYVQERVPGFSPVGIPERLPEGNLNVVWRVEGEERSVIVKHAPPHIASNPDIPLDRFRLVIEARCLQAFGSEGGLRSLSDDSVRPPRLIDVNRQKAVLIMEDVGRRPTLDRWLSGDKGPIEVSETSRWGHHLGRFIGRLHAVTADDSSYAERFDNRPMQETRHAVQYQGVSDMLNRADVPNAAALGRRAESLGKQLLEPGICLTMGDLWPRSVMVGAEDLRIIDWELAHFGRPLQDVAHWLAHLWMLEHVASSSWETEAVGEQRRAFLDAYFEAIGPARDDLWTSREEELAAVHLGAEILVRAVGPFQEGYVYAGLAPDHPTISEAVEEAVGHLQNSEAIDVLST